MATTHLARDPNDRIIAGVCGGLARWLGRPGVLDSVASGDTIVDPTKETSASAD